MELLCSFIGKVWPATKRLLAGFAVMMVVVLSAGNASKAATAPNILFIAVDDLRPQLACYGKSFMHSPNIDQLASRGVLFERAYCMVPTCGASRASLMTGLRPMRQRFVNFMTWAEKDAPRITTLNTHFKQHGYRTISLGKVFHHPEDNVAGWSEKPWVADDHDYQRTEQRQKIVAEHQKKYPKRPKPGGPAYEAAEAPDENYRDGQNATRAIEYLQKLAEQPSEPFFLAVGFHKPHLPFTAPQKYWDLYDADKIDLPDNYFPPQGAPKIALHNSGELRTYAGIPAKGPVDRATARKLIHGYYACVSFVDAQIGKVLRELDRLKLTETTVVVLWGDHGWQLGEHGMWNKHACFETSMHAPLLVVTPHDEVVVPGMRVAALVEFIDIYPSLCQLAGLPQPEHLQGQSFVPLLHDPQAPWKSFAVGRIRTGDTIRADNYRYTEYTGNPNARPERMLYDHREDPDENVNVADRSQNESLNRQLADELHKISASAAEH